MYHRDFLKVAAVTPLVHVGNPKRNVEEMLRLLPKIDAAMAVFPELGITAYTCNDLFYQHSMLEETYDSLEVLLKENPFKGLLIVGAPLEIDGLLYNCALVIEGSKVLGIVPKFFLPNTQEFYEKRWFTSGKDVIKRVQELRLFGQTIPFGSLLFKSDDDLYTFGIEICEDMWAPFSPGNTLALNGAKIIVNLSASNEYLGKREIRRRTILEHSRRNGGAYVYCSAGVNESTSETVFSGHNVICQNGELIRETENFSQTSEIIYGDLDLAKINFARKQFSSFRDTLITPPYPLQTVYFKANHSHEYVFEKPFDQTPFVPKKDTEEAFHKIAALQENALIKRMKHIRAKAIVIGISGGLDSTLALLVACRVVDALQLPRTAILGVTMPAFGTSKQTKSQADRLMEVLGIEAREINIEASVNDHFKLIGHDGKTPDITYENAQARQRTMILMDLANMVEGIVLGTGDMSELALGFTTYNGDQMSMYGINQGIPKTLVRFMVDAYAKYGFKEDLRELTEAIIMTPISPELIANQITEDTIGKYDINDFILHRFLRYGDTESRLAWLLEKTFSLSQDDATSYVKNFFKRFYSQQFKRQASPDAPKILDVSLSPRSDHRMPSDVAKGSWHE